MVSTPGLEKMTSAQGVPRAVSPLLLGPPEQPEEPALACAPSSPARPARNASITGAAARPDFGRDQSWAEFTGQPTICEVAAPGNPINRGFRLSRGGGETARRPSPLPRAPKRGARARS